MFDVRLRDGRLRGKGALADRVDRFSALRADARTSPSELLVSTLRDMKWLRPDTDVEVIPYPFDPSPFADIPDAAHTGPTVAVVGRLEWRKGLDVLIEAAARLIDNGTEVKLVFAGQSSGEIEGRPSGTWLEELAGRLGVPCRFEGHLSRSELKAVYQEARVVAVPSRFESFSIAGLEGMAAGRPVVASATTGVSTWVKRWNGGTVVPPRDPVALADALARYLKDAQLAVDTGARGRVGTAELEPDKIAEQRERVYQAAVRRHEDSRHGPGRQGSWQAGRPRHRQ
jgi:glycosyltransferase involved in cell wall biosynthesis